MEAVTAVPVEAPSRKYDQAQRVMITIGTRGRHAKIAAPRQRLIEMTAWLDENCSAAAGQ